MTLSLPPSYFLEQLRTEPREGAERIVARRGEAIGVMSAADEAQRDFEVAQMLGQTVAAFRESFWATPVETLVQQLDALDCEHFPEYARSVERLKRAALGRDELAVVIQQLGKKRLFAEYLRRTLTLGPRDIAGIREIVHREMFEQKKAKPFKAAAQKIATDFPAAYAIDREWIDEVIRAKSPSRGWGSIELPVPFWVLWIILIIVVRGCRELTR